MPKKENFFAVIFKSRWKRGDLKYIYMKLKLHLHVDKNAAHVYILVLNVELLHKRMKGKDFAEACVYVYECVAVYIYLLTWK